MKLENFVLSWKRTYNFHVIQWRKLSMTKIATVRFKKKNKKKTVWFTSERKTGINIFLFFPRKQDFTFHVNCLHRNPVFSEK